MQMARSRTPAQVNAMIDQLYVGNLPSSATKQGLADRFCRSGTVDSVAIISQESAGRIQRYGLVDMSTRSEADLAIGRLNMTLYDDTVISVSFALPAQQRVITGA